MRTCENCGREFRSRRIPSCPYCGYVNAPSSVCEEADLRHKPETRVRPRAVLGAGTADSAGLPCDSDEEEEDE